jgi:serine/threonine protein kinase
MKRLGNQSKRKFGEVFLVEHKETQERSVMKLVKKQKTNNHIVEQLKDESLFDFDLDGLPKVIETFESSTEYICLLSYKNGIPLDVYWKSLKRKERLPFLIHLIHELNTIFNHLRKKHIVHCDIKPGNILINPQDKSVSLIDFGLAIRTDQIKKRETLFPLGYAAPELLLNHLDIVDQTTDIFALGILIWRLYEGKLPLTHRNPSIYTNLQLTHPLPESTEIKKGLFQILSKMTYKHQFKIPPNKMEQTEVKQWLRDAQKKRYQNLESVLNDLKSMQEKRRFLPKNIFSKS